MKQNNNKPELRFLGNTDEWEQRKFKLVFDFLQNNNLSRSELNNDGEVMNVHYGDILVKYGAVLDVLRDELTYLIDSSIAKKYQASLLRNGDVIIADAAEDETVGKCSEISGLSDEIVLSGLHTIPCRPTMKFAEGYLGYHMNSSAYHDQLLPLIQGTKISSISKAAIQDTRIFYPKSEEEQERIGTYFKNIDHLINLYQSKFDKLINVKKSMLEKMFPRKGCGVPEVRFLGFTDSWEQCKLGDYIIEYNEVTIVNNQYPALTSSRKGIFLQTEYFAGNQIASDDNTGYNIVPYGYFTYRHMSDDEIFYFNINDIVENGIVSTLYPVFTTNEKLDSRYLQYQLNYGHEFARFAVLQKQGGSRTYMYLSKLKQLSLTIPQSIDEQKKISDFFMELDHLITLYQRKREKLINIKKACMDKMFV